MSNICPNDASGEPLYPPRVTPPPKPLNLPQTFIKFLRNPLLTIPESVYREPLAILRGPPAIVWVTDPALVKFVLVDHCEDFPPGPTPAARAGGLIRQQYSDVGREGLALAAPDGGAALSVWRDRPIRPLHGYWGRVGD